MKPLKVIAFVLAASAFQPVLAGVQNGTQAPDCIAANNVLQQTYNDRLRKSVPSQDPGTYVDKNFDVKGILSQDVTSGFSKLMNLDFGSIAMSIINRNIASAVQSGANALNNSVNNVMTKNGVNGAAAGAINGAVSNTTGNLSTGATNGITGAIPKIIGPYGPVPAAP